MLSVPAPDHSSRDAPRCGSWDSGSRRGRRPVATFEIGEDGAWGPFRAARHQSYELVLTRDDIYQAFYSEDITRGFLHSHSYTGNPLACRAALATLDIFEEDDVLNRNRELATKMTIALAPLAEHERARHFRQRGMIFAFDAIEPDLTIQGLALLYRRSVSAT